MRKGCCACETFHEHYLGRWIGPEGLDQRIKTALIASESKPDFKVTRRATWVNPENDLNYDRAQVKKSHASWVVAQIPLLSLILLLVGSGCSDRGIQVYEVPKEERFEIAAAGHQQQNRPSLPHLHTESLPAGWTELPPAGMRVANYQVLGPDGQMAEVGVFALPGVADIELESVNLWRRELELEPLTPENLPEARTAVEVGEQEGNLYEMTSSKVLPGKTLKSSTLGVVLSRPEARWFIKMTGQAEFVEQQKDDFLSFLQGLEFHGADAHGPAVAQTSPRISTNTERVPPTADLPTWRVPEGWRERPPGTMLLANWAVSGKAGGQADVTVSRLPGDGGGLLPNVNRWRGQLSLGPTTEPELSTQVSKIEVDGEKVPMVDIQGARAGRPARMLAVALPKHGETWFYKMMGDPSVIEEQKDTFIQFIQSAY